MMVRAALIGLLMMVSALAGAPAQAAERSATLDCPMPPGWAAVERQQARFVVFGELHGTEQSPQFVGQLACALAARGQRVLVAVEHGANLVSAWQEAWQLAPGPFDAALAAQGWSGRNDGVGSKAYFDMLVRLHLLKARGLPLAVVPYAGFTDKAQFDRFATLPGQGGHEAAMAENIATAAKAGNYDVVLVLVGNLHARKSPITRGSITFEPMAMQLARQAKVVTLDMRYGSGTSWICQVKPGAVPGPQRRIGPADMTCGNAPAPGYPGLHGAARIVLAPQAKADEPLPYDGIFWLGPVTGSPPVLR
ncbi:MAG: hypothetical protein RL339_386 [Pseudomonadota bacterium]|jgi:hypothetical protein